MTLNRRRIDYAGHIPKKKKKNIIDRCLSSVCLLFSVLYFIIIVKQYILSYCRHDYFFFCFVIALHVVSFANLYVIKNLKFTYLLV